MKLKDLASLSQEQSNSLEAKLVTIQAQFEQATKARIKSVVMASLSLSHTHAHAHAHTHARARTLLQGGAEQKEEKEEGPKGPKSKTTSPCCQTNS